VAAFAEIAGEELGLTFGMNLERRTFGHPDRSIFFGGFLRADVENDAIQDQPPECARNLDDARVREELAQVALEGGGRRRLRGTQVDEDDRDAGCCSVLVRGFRSDFWH